MNNTLYGISLIAVISAVTILLRALPFMIFRNGKTTPGFVTYLGKVLPYAIMGMLVVFCMKSVNILSGSHGIPELIAGAVTVISYCWKRNTLLSVIAGTASYMLLLQLVFA